MISILTAAFATAASSAAIEKRNELLPAKFTLQSSTTGLDDVLYNDLMYANGSAYIGNIKYSVCSEPLLLSGGNKSASFTSIHSTPTGWQNMYIYCEESKPIGFTIPHSGAIPTNASTIGFTECDGLLKFDRGNGPEGLWKACPAATELGPTGSWQIYWDGDDMLPDCVEVDLTIVEDTCSA